MNFSKSKVLTKNFSKSKILKLERRFQYDTQNRASENRESANRDDFLHPDEGRQSERRGSAVERQTSRANTFNVGCSESCRNGEKNCEQEIKTGRSQTVESTGRPKCNTGLRQRTLFIVAFLLPLSSQFQLR